MSFGDDTLHPDNIKPPRQLWRHKKRGTLYVIEADDAHLQCSSAPEFESVYGQENWTVYRDVRTNKVYVRLTAEFNDGRFERVP